MSVLGLAVLVAVAVVAARWLYPRLLARTPKGRERAQLQALLKACHGDEHVAERLIFAEMEHDHDVSFERAARRARKRLLRDRIR